MEKVDSGTSGKARVTRGFAPNPRGFMLRPRQIAGLQALSEREDVPQAALVRRAIDRLLREHGLLEEVAR